MTDDDSNTDLSAFFDAVRAETPRMPAGLAARMMADAERAQAEAGGLARIRREPGWLTQFAAAVGGWYGAGGLVAACAAGVWIGLAPPEGLPDPGLYLLNAETGWDVYESGGLMAAVSEEG